MPPKSRQQLFLDLFLPSIMAFCSMRFAGLDAEARAEATQDVVTSAWRTVSSASDDRLWHGETDRRGRITPSTITNFAVVSYRSGRRIAGHSSMDAVGPSAVADGTRVVGINASGIDQDSASAAADAKTMVAIPAALLTRSTAAPVAQVRAKLDWETIAQRCTPRARDVLALIIEGYSGIEIAQRLGVSPARVVQLKDKIAGVARSLGYMPTSSSPC